MDAGSSCKEELRSIRDVAMRGSEIVRQLMIYAGKESAVVELIDLSKIVDEMLALLKVSVTKHAVIKANLDRDLPAIRASAAQIRQIVMNLITNASDAIGDRDGVIRVITRRVTLKGESAAIVQNVAGRRLRATGGLRHRSRHVPRNAGQGVRPVLHHQIRGPRTWARCRAGDRAESRRSHPAYERAGQRHYISNIAAMCGNHGWRKRLVRYPRSRSWPSHLSMAPFWLWRTKRQLRQAVVKMLRKSWP